MGSISLVQYPSMDIPSNVINIVAVLVVVKRQLSADQLEEEPLKFMRHAMIELDLSRLSLLLVKFTTHK